MQKSKSTDTKTRRELLRSLVAGSAVVGGNKLLPETWSKPLTDSILLPSHALTTTEPPSYNAFDMDYNNSTDQIYDDGYY